ncbi:MAG: biopolymer transporter ExbD [Myxococcota bacterium]
MPKLSPQQRRLIRRKTRVPDHDPASESDELNIVPFLDVVVNLIMFLLMTMTVVLSTHEVAAQLPSLRPNGPPGPVEWRATVVLLDSGEVAVVDNAGTLQPGCREHGAAATVPRVGGEPDWLALRTCAEVLHGAHPDVTKVRVTADPSVPLASVIRAMDAMRGSEAQPLFPDVQLAAGIR